MTCPCKYDECSCDVWHPPSRDVECPGERCECGHFLIDHGLGGCLGTAYCDCTVRGTAYCKVR